jgi:hypothetical protein
MKREDRHPAGLPLPAARITILPAGELHPYSACAFCGARTDLHSTLLAATQADAMVCNDFVGCLRRRAA